MTTLAQVALNLSEVRAQLVLSQIPHRSAIYRHGHVPVAAGRWAYEAPETKRDTIRIIDKFCEARTHQVVVLDHSPLTAEHI